MGISGKGCIGYPSGNGLSTATVLGKTSAENRPETLGEREAGAICRPPGAWLILSLEGRIGVKALE